MGCYSYCSALCWGRGGGVLVFLFSDWGARQPAASPTSTDHPYASPHPPAVRMVLMITTASPSEPSAMPRLCRAGRKGGAGLSPSSSLIARPSSVAQYPPPSRQCIIPEPHRFAGGAQLWIRPVELLRRDAMVGGPRPASTARLDLHLLLALARKPARVSTRGGAADVVMSRADVVADRTPTP